MRIKIFFSLLVIVLLSVLGGCAQTNKAIDSLQEALTPMQTKNKPTPKLAAGSYFVHAWALNLRKCPGSQCRIITVLKRGQEVSASEWKAGWIKVSLVDSQKQGWVAARYLGAEKPLSRVRRSDENAGPAPEPPPPAGELAPAVSSPPAVKGELAN